MKKIDINGLISKGRHFIEEDLWTMDVSQKRGLARTGYGLLRILVMTTREFLEQKASIRASALTYYTLLSIVPVVALAFAIAKGFGLEGLLSDYIRGSLNSSEVANYLIDFSGSALENTKGGIIAGVGVTMLLYSVFKLLNNIESAFNTMWCVEKSRSIMRKVADYLCIMLFAPILLLTASSATLMLKSSIRSLFAESFTVLQDVMFSILPYFMVWTAFTLLYLIMPNTKVKPLAAIVAGVVTGTVFQIVQWVYITFQIGVNNAGAVYGSFAFLPLLLAWLQLAWTIVLAGSKIAFSIQNVSDYSLEHGVTEISHTMERRLAILIMRKSVTAFKKGERPTGMEQANEMGIPKPLFFMVTDKLKRAGLLAELVSDNDKKDERVFIPGVDLADISAQRVCEAIDSLGDDDKMSQIRDAEYPAVVDIETAMRMDGQRSTGREPLTEMGKRAQE